jgi:hypothetical protein
MKHFIDDTNTYKILDENNAELLTIQLTEEPNNQIILTTEKEVYAGPIEFLSTSNNI